MSIPKNSHYYFLFQPNPPKLHRHIFSFFTLYYAIHNNLIYPIAISKPASTQLPHYYPNTSPTFNTFHRFINYYTNPSNIPLK